MIPQACVIGGQMVPTAETLDVLNPSDGQLLARVARAGKEHIDLAVSTAGEVSASWRRTSARERSRILRQVADVLRDHREELALMESQDTGKPLSQARADADVAARYFEYYANTVEAFFGQVVPTGEDFHAFVRHEPYGVTGHIIPWNYPMQIGCRTVAPAIAVGNCCVVKPAEEAPLTMLKVAELALDAGLPPGVLNVVPGLGSEAGAELAAHDGIDHLSFTGSAAVGTAVAQAAADNIVPVALELGGKSPNIVFPDADLTVAVSAIMRAMLQNAGQTCSAGSRLLVHRSVHAELLAMLADSLRSIRIGSGPDDPDLGPLISATQHARVSALVEQATASGKPYLGGTDSFSLPARGFFFPPTIFNDVDPASTIAQEEVFGPVLAVMPFDDIDHAVELANATDYALIAAVWTGDINTAFRIVNDVHAGQIYVNNYGAGGGVEFAFGGYKKSGYGREKGFQAMAEVCQTKTVVVKVTG